MTLTFVDGIVATCALFGMVGLLFMLQWHRCSNNTNEENQQINALVVRQEELARHVGATLKPMDEAIRDMGYTIAGCRRACKGKDDGDANAGTTRV